MSLSVTAAAIRSAALPSASPGKLRLRFFPSRGTTNGVRAQNAGRLITGATVTVPESSAGRSSASSWRAAAIDAYSVPCTPAITVRCGPSPASPTTLTYGIPSSPCSPRSTRTSLVSIICVSRCCHSVLYRRIRDELYRALQQRWSAGLRIALVTPDNREGGSLQGSRRSHPAQGRISGGRRRGREGAAGSAGPRGGDDLVRASRGQRERCDQPARRQPVRPVRL